MMGKILLFAGAIALVVFLIVLGPLLILWSLNTLFPVLAIPYTIWTWVAALILGAIVSPSVKVTRK
jgi:hypothetical protein